MRRARVRRTDEHERRDKGVVVSRHVQATADPKQEHQLIALQRQVGNAAVSTLIAQREAAASNGDSKDRSAFKDPERLQAYDLGVNDAKNFAPPREGLDIAYIAPYRAGYNSVLRKLEDATPAAHTDEKGEDPVEAVTSAGVTLMAHSADKAAAEGAEHAAKTAGKAIPTDIPVAGLIEMATELKSDTPMMTEEDYRASPREHPAEYVAVRRRDLDEAMVKRVEENRDAPIPEDESAEDRWRRLHPSEGDYDASVPDEETK